MSLIDRLRFYPASLILRAQCRAAQRLLAGPYRWQSMDRLGIPGHGTELIRLDFPPPAGIAPRWGHGRPPHPELAAILESNRAEHIRNLHACLSFAAVCCRWPATEDRSQPAQPWRNNIFLTPFDQVALYGMLRHLKPARYLEIGSGMSTRIAWQARQVDGFPMEITSIDPDARLAVAHLCENVHRCRLEEVVDEVLSLATARTVVFFDGSHRSFPGSDVTVFFLEILPRLPAGTIIHIHDIHLPWDYPAIQLNRFWSEQYLLAAMLLGGARGLRVILPCAHLATQAEIRQLLSSALGQERLEGSGFWIEKI